MKTFRSSKKFNSKKKKNSDLLTTAAELFFWSKLITLMSNFVKTVKKRNTSYKVIADVKNTTHDARLTIEWFLQLYDCCFNG